MNIRRRLTQLVLASVVPAVLASTLLIVHSYQQQRTSIALSTLETARALVQAVDRELASGRTALQALATSPYLAAGDLEAFHAQAREAMKHLPGNNIVLTDASGQQLLNTLQPFGEPLPVHGNPAQLRWVFDTGLPAISDLYVGAVARRPLVGIDVPVRRGGEVLYDISMGFFPEHLSRILSGQALPAGWIASILDSQGRVIARTHSPERYIGQKGPPAVVESMAQQQEGSLETNTLEGISVVAVFSRSSVSRWSVVIGIPTAALGRQMWTSIAWIVAGALVLLAGGIALAHLLGARITRSIRGLTGPAAALGRGEKVVVPPLQLEEAQEVGRALENAAVMLREREEILAVVAHDLRNPLSALMAGATGARRLAEKLPGAAPLRPLLEVLADVPPRMSGMVDDLLAVAVSSSGDGSMLKTAPVSASTLLTRAANAVRPLYERQGIGLHTEISGVVPEALVDADRVLRVLINLLDNALKFTAQSGQVMIAAKAAPHAVQFSVANSGPALSAAELESMFRRFWQARPEDRKGVGLGLSICRSIVESHGGRIWAEPAEGKRVRVCFELPAAPAASAGGPHAGEPRLRRPDERVHQPQ